jgi:hypothetical protein
MFSTLNMYEEPSMKKVLASILLSSMLLVGCTNLPQQTTPFVDIGIQYAVAKVVAKSADPANTATRLTALADEILATPEALIPVDAVNSAISAYFPVETLAPEDQFLVAMLVASLSNYVVSLELPEGTLATSHMIARHIKFGASFYLPK